MLLKNFLGGIFIWFIYNPGRKILRFFFYKVLVKLYTLYLRIAKRLGLEGLKGRFSITLNQRLAHILVITMTVLLLFVNLNAKTNVNASGFVEKGHRTILTDLVTSEFGDFENEEQLVMETFDQEVYISGAQQSYLDNLSSFRPQASASLTEPADEEYYEETANTGDSIVRPNLASTKITEQDRTETVSYTVEPGDTISTIAEKFGVSASTILWENELSSYSIIRPNDTLDILPMTGVTHKVVRNETISSIAAKYDVEESSIMTTNKVAVEDGLQVGQKLIIPDGEKIIYVAPTPKVYTGFDAIKNIVTTAPSGEVSNKMAWPTVGHTITQYYSWRHLGLDIANKTGTPLYAADSGTIEVAGWGTGYGNQILISHGGGKKTRYAHMSKFYVGVGDKVTKGQQIGEMGSTGWSTGPHVHFEVIIDGQKYNPLNYIK